ncbi:MAG: sulfotransferase family 2 domain-containing protein [Kiritimatiellia bacterium]
MCTSLDANHRLVPQGSLPAPQSLPSLRFEARDEFVRLSQHVRSSLDLIAGHHVDMLMDSLDSSFTVATLLRDPVERIVSVYYYVRRSPDHRLYQIARATGMNLEKFVTSDVCSEASNWCTRHFSRLPHSEIARDPAKALDLALERLTSEYHIVGILEDFPHFVEQLRRKANLVRKFRDMRLNVTEDRPSLAEIPASTIEKIQELNQLDISLYRAIQARYARPL